MNFGIRHLIPTKALWYIDLKRLSAAKTWIRSLERLNEPVFRSSGPRTDARISRLKKNGCMPTLFCVFLWRAGLSSEENLLQRG